MTFEGEKYFHIFLEVLPLLKILIPNYAAGAIIGKGGTNIGDLQNQYGAKIRLSPSREFYPGTEERIVVLTGDCLLYTSPSPRDKRQSRMPSSA